MGRTLYIDESGDSSNTLVLAGLSFETGLDVDAETAIEGLVGELAALIQGFDASEELHAYKLARELRRKEVIQRRHETLLRNHERDFIYQHLLHHLSAWPSAKLHLVMWKWAGPAREQEEKKGERQRILMIRPPRMDRRGGRDLRSDLRRCVLSASLLRPWIFGGRRNDGPLSPTGRTAQLDRVSPHPDG